MDVLNLLLSEQSLIGFQVSVRYIGKLNKNGKIFDSNVGRAPFKFRLGTIILGLQVTTTCFNNGGNIFLFVLAGVGQVTNRRKTIRHGKKE